MSGAEVGALTEELARALAELEARLSVAESELGAAGGANARAARRMARAVARHVEALLAACGEGRAPGPPRRDPAAAAGVSGREAGGVDGDPRRGAAVA